MGQNRTRQNYTLHLGDCLDVMGQMEPNTVDSIITDPPYGLNFMSSKWDHGVPGVPFWEAALRVAKPGAMLLAFGGTRTYHRLTVAIEDAGWEIRDCLMWLYGSGFPKSHNISAAIDKAAGMEREVVGSKGLHKFNGTRAEMNHGKYGKDHRSFEDADALTAPATEAAALWDGWGTALKPAWEPIILAMKPLDGTFAENAIRHGVAGLNIEGGRVDSPILDSDRRTSKPGAGIWGKGKHHPQQEGEQQHNPVGRWPANVILDEEAAALLDEQTGDLGKSSGGRIGNKEGGIAVPGGRWEKGDPGFGDSGGGQVDFFTALKVRGLKETRGWRGCRNGRIPTSGA